MDEKNAYLLLLIISKEIKQSYESPVILLTFKDYAENILECLIEMTNLLSHNAIPSQIIEVIHTFHLGWLQAVQEVENFMKIINETSKEIIIRTIDFTVECMKKRQLYFKSYIDLQKDNLNREQRVMMQAEIEILKDMRELVTHALKEKQNFLRSQSDKSDFKTLLKVEIEELLNWIDKLNDQLTMEFIKIVHTTLPLDPNDLVKTLENIIDEVATFPTVENTVDAKEQSAKSQQFAIDAVRDIRGLDPQKILEKIKHLEGCLDMLKIEDASKLAIEYKTLYLKERLQSLQNLNTSVNTLKLQRKNRSPNDNDNRIFNHYLPPTERCRLIERLLKLWSTAIAGDSKRKSIISILSVTDMKEVFYDDVGNFSVDKYGRKIYTQQNDDLLYQLNDQNELVPLDDEKNVYFYDDCGRYYLNPKRERVYKAHASASEYLLNKSGYMLKFSEFEDGHEYWFDNLGRYYRNAAGRKIYKDEGSDEEYKSDGLGNLVVIRGEMPDYTACPRGPMILEESMYIKNAVGEALKKSIANVVIAQPPDPIIFLADCLEKYGLNLIARRKKALDLEELIAERERLKALVPIIETPATSSDYGDEASTIDLNFTEYKTMQPNF